MFTSVKKQMREQFDAMVKTGSVLFVADTNKDSLWEAYLSGFATEEERQHHNCNCCRQFIKNYGNMVIIRDSGLVTVWDFLATEPLYEASVRNLGEYVRSCSVRNLFINETNKLGTDHNYDLDKQVTWQHFYCEAPARIVTKKADLDSQRANYRDLKQVFKRGLDELTVEAVDTVLELIAQGSLYKGTEFQPLLQTFSTCQKEYGKLEDRFKDNYCWIKISFLSYAVLKIRNSAIGTLLIDLSEGIKTLDESVSAYERVVAPTNYKRPTAIITKGMIEEAEAKIAELGFEGALERRFATPEDININNVLFVNRNAKKASGVFEEMKEDTVVSPKTFSKVEEITIDKFIEEVLPTAKGVEVLVENSHLNNLVSVIAPVAPEAPVMFKWGNPFSWTYVNGLTDSIKEKVKAAGGNVNAELRVSLAWYNHDDLDLHVKEPNGTIIYFRSYKRPAMAPSTGQLDVDMNAGHGTTRTPVENIVWTDKNQMQEGEYTVIVDQYQLRENSHFGCEVEVECNGEVFSFEDNKKMVGKTVICTFNYSKANGITFSTGQTSSTISKEKWGVSTNKFQKVSMIMNSPNHWEDQIGNKHVFFAIEGAKNDEPARGFYNEFLKEDLDKNRKVFEVLGAKLKVEPSDKQVTGIGFSTTQRNHIICRVEGNFKRTLKVTF